MTGKTHMAIGLAAGLVLSHGEPMETQLVFVLASTFGSLIPDLDHPKAKLNQRLLLLKNKSYRILFYLLLAGAFLYFYFMTKNILFGLLAIMTFFISISTHRGFTHSILGFLIATSIAKIIATDFNLPSIYPGFSIGYASHMIADFFTVKGIKLFYPMDQNISSPIMIKTDENLESIIITIVGLYVMYLLIYSI